MKVRTYGKVTEVAKIPDLRHLQFKSYSRFLQRDVPAAKRQNHGLESIVQEIFPIKSYDGSLSLVYLSYDLGRPRYTPDDCRKLRLTYGAPFKIMVRLEKEEPIEEEVYLGELPLMIGGGEFIINGAERVIVSQLHRSPGVDFSEEVHSIERRLHSFRIIPERGSWIEANVTKKENLVVRIDQSGKFPATILLRAMDEKFSTNRDLIRAFYKTEKIKISGPGSEVRARGRRSAQDVIHPKTGEILLEAGDEVPEKGIKVYREAGLKELEVIKGTPDVLILNTLKEDPTRNRTEALLRIYQRLRPGNPAQKEKAADLFADKFFNSNKYRLGRVGRFRLNRKFEQKIAEKEMTLRPEDFLHAIRYILDLRAGRGEIDDIDHLGNRRVRTIDELAGDELRKGFLKLKRTIQERMSLMDPETISPRNIINSKTISSAIEYFFGRGELSQVVDQTNPLAQLTHERRLSALGPGGLNRKRAGFEVRDVHISHYGRICPIETPEGTNIGLISSLAIYANTDEYGFLITPYRVVKNGRVQDDIQLLRADQEENAILGPADMKIDEAGKIIGKKVLARINGEFLLIDPKSVQYMDVSPKQLVGVSASLIPFLEHNDANRALMGSNMQRQAVPLLQSEPPIVGTGMEGPVAQNSGMVVLAPKDGEVTKSDASQIVVGDERIKLRKFVGLNERTCLNQKPIVTVGEHVKKGQIIADGAATYLGELALGKSVVVGFMPWDGYNFEDAILVSEKLVKEDRYTSIHIEEFEIEIRETKLGREEFTRDIPNVSEKALRNLDENGIVRTGTRVKPGDILVGKVVPKSKTELSPEEKLLHAIFGRAGEDVKNDSLEAPSGVEGIVIDAKKFSRKSQLTESEKHKNRQEIRTREKEYQDKLTELIHLMLASIKEAYGGNLRDLIAKREIRERDLLGLQVSEIKLKLDYERFDPPAASKSRSKIKIYELVRRFLDKMEDAESERNLLINRIQRGDELPTGVLELVKVYVATRRTLSVGDKMAGRHGNKGVIAKILPEEDMPFLEDGTPLDMLLNPLGVPSRMNVGQIMETHLGWAAKILGFRALSPVFGGCSEADIRAALREAGLPEDGKVTLYDGRTGRPLDQKVTVGYLYMMKLHHLVDDKVHARATGPYSLITQQPLGGKARFGGQRFGEMEVWALEAYGAANILQELLTVKSDDVDGRTKIYESMVKGENTLEPGTPVSYDVLTNEIKGLGLNMVLNKKRV